ncbi:MAG: hypothetical protein DCC67_01960 [Planctomycetota bacterium]|nr:MAG: hypothetical protein DCC67_01960 [Planctomycetota bacterium]
MARASSTKPAAAAGDGAPPAAAFRPAAAKIGQLARRRWRALSVLGVVLAIGLGLRGVWLRVSPRVAASERYLIAASAIAITPPPEWIVADVRAQAIHHGQLDRRLSILDPAFFSQIQHAFALHPWVLKVERIEKKPGPGVQVDLVYRRPIAVIESPHGNGRELLPVDRTSTLLPPEDVPLIRRQYLPRIINIAGRPPVGQRWEDGRVAGAVALAERLGDLWEPLHLVEIVPSARQEVLGNRQYFVYEIVTRGGTRIIWGAAPDEQVPGEASFTAKLQRLKTCVEKYGPLDTVKAPGAVNVRSELLVTPRMVKKPAEAAAPKTQVK